MQTATYVSPNMKCGGCAATVTDALKGLTGVQDVNVDLGTKQVTVAYDQVAVQDDQMRAAMAGAGFPPAG